MTRRPKNKIKVSSIETIPHELVSEILARVAASSFTDIFNAKLSCKRLNEISEDRYVYQHISLEKFPVIPWWPLNEKQEAFLKKCEECGNAEILYRKAVVDYFGKSNIGSACHNLEKALKSSHMGALYLAWIVFLLSSKDELKFKGIKSINSAIQSKFMKKNLILCRNNLNKILDQMWVTNPILKRQPTYCTTQHQQQGKNQWSDEDSECEDCIADRELKYICARYQHI